MFHQQPALFSGQDSSVVSILRWLLDMSSDDLKVMGINLVGHRRRLLSALSQLRRAEETDPRQEVTHGGVSAIPENQPSGSGSAIIPELLEALNALRMRPQCARATTSSQEEARAISSIQEEGSDNSGQRLDMEQPLRALQKRLLHSLERNPWWLDPSRNPLAESEFANLTEWHPIDDVLQGHDRISRFFSYGPNEGQSVDSLVKALWYGDVRPHQLPTLVAARHDGRLYTVYGNRRLCALRKYSTQCQEAGYHPEKIKVIVHPMPFEHLDEKTRRQFMVKMVLACSTSNEGQQAYCR